MSKLRLRTEAAVEVYNAKDVYEEARERGNLWVVPAHPLLLQLDLDTEPGLEQQRAMQLLETQTNAVREVFDTTSPGGKKHRYIRLTHPLDLEVRVAIQALLGSDPMRELLSLLRSGVREPELVLFETEQTYQYVREKCPELELPDVV